MAVLPAELLDRVAEIITRYSMIPPGSRIGVAVSGGADSIVLLHLLKRLSAELQTSLSILHVNHGLRGIESDGDEEFVRNVALEFGLPFFSEPGRLSEGNIEERAREARRDIFRR